MIDDEKLLETARHIQNMNYEKLYELCTEYRERSDDKFLKIQIVEFNHQIMEYENIIERITRKQMEEKMKHEKKIKIELYNDHFENAKRYQIPRAQLILADIPYNIGVNAYGSRSDWYINGDNKNGESDKAGKEFFDTDKDFKIYNFFNFATRLLRKEPKEKGKAPCMIIFCSWQQLNELRDYAKQFGFNHAQPLFFIKNTSSQVLKANMRVCGATEFALVLYRDKLPKFNNHGRMILDWFDWNTTGNYPKIHPTQKPVKVLKRLIEIYTDPYDVVIDPVAGSASTLRACAELNRSCYGFEIKKDFYNKAKKEMLTNINMTIDNFIDF